MALTYGPARFWTALALAVLAGLSLIPAAACADEASGLAPEAVEVFGEIELEGTAFFEDPQFVGQDRDGASVAGQVTFLAEWADGDVTFKFTPFARFDIQDDRRTHADVRELKFDVIDGNWSVTIGADTVFWGKTEVQHLVDVINQTDQVEGLDDEDRLGQPMLRVGYLSDLGEVSAYVMPYFRERTFPGVSGRLRSNPAVNTALPLYDTSANEWTPSFALRYEGVIGDIDLGLSAFHGLGRDPTFFFDAAVGALRPFYERVTQGGIDVQYTSGPALWKGEGIVRTGQKNARFIEEDFVAVTGGLDYTFFGIADTNADLGLIAEYAWDSRGDDSLSVLQNDAIGGVRLALNDEADTSLLLTGAADVTDGSIALRLEAERRFLDSVKASIESQAFLNTDRGGFAGAFADDSFVRLKLTYFFGNG